MIDPNHPAVIAALDNMEYPHLPTALDVINGAIPHLTTKDLTNAHSVLPVLSHAIFCVQDLADELDREGDTILARRIREALATPIPEKDTPTHD